MHTMNGPDVQRYVGMSAASAYTQLLLTHLRVQYVSVCRYRSPPSLQQRIQLTSPDLLLIDQALALRKSTRLPFWSALFTTCLLNETHTPQLVGAAFFHSGPGEAVAYDRDAIEAGALEELARQGAANVGISSEVRDASGAAWHLPLLDFHCDVSPHNEELAALVCAHLMPDGYLLIDSGDSYHACGFELSTPEERVHMLGKALLTAPIIDIHYIAHQLQQDASSIRISKGGKASRGPFVVRAWSPG